MRSLSFIAFILLVSDLGFATPVGGVRGQIKDPSGAGVSGVRLTLVNTTTRVQRTATSNINGTFEILELEPAQWSLSAEARGFKRTTIPDVVVEVDRTTRTEIVLQLGEASEVVEVAA